jgi:hypothetical protein
VLGKLFTVKALKAPKKELTIFSGFFSFLGFADFDKRGDGESFQ